MTHANPLHAERDGFSVSIVVYHPNIAQFEETLASFARACGVLRDARPGLPITLYLVDNGGMPATDALCDRLRTAGVTCHIVGGHGNVGFGRGHNLAIERADSRRHLILNPDIDLEPDALALALDFMDRHHDVGLLTPWIGDEHGGQQYLCRRYPALLDLFARGFLPASLRRFLARRLMSYEMRDLINDRDVLWDPPIVSGCFMLFRTDVLGRLRGFDPRYFLYFEDYDLSLRTREFARIAYVPAVRVLHHGGGAARKGVAHIRMFAASAFKFYRRFGWKWL